MNKNGVLALLSLLVLVVVMAESKKERYEALKQPCRITEADDSNPKNSASATKIKPPKLLKREIPKSSNGCSMHGTMEFELVVNTKCEVTCVRLVSNNGETEDCALKYAETLRTWVYEPATTSEGVPIAVYNNTKITTKRN